jgi:lysophospholipase L1-like esterase
VKIRPGSRILFIGDSVTDCGRLRPVGAGSPGALGRGYVAQVAARMARSEPGHAPQCVNMGVSGDTVRDLALRWESDVTGLEPDWLTVMIGINDVWRHFDGVDPSAAVGPEEFERTCGDLLARTRPWLHGLVLMTPYYLQPDLADPMRAMMDALGAAVARLAGRHGALLVDTQRALDLALAGRPHSALAPDRVHPNEEGHRVLADAFLRSVGA